MKGEYLYGITNSSHLGGVLGSHLGDISTVEYQDLAAVVRESEYKDYQSLAKKEAIKELTEHQQIIEKIMEESPVLPVKFGTILKDEDEIRSVLEKGYLLLQDTLQKMEEKIELDLVCFWNEQKAAQMAYQKSKKIRDYYTSEVARRDSSDGGMANKIALGKIVAQYLAAKREKISTQILKVLKREAVGSCSHVLADVNMLLNQAFLVEKENEESFNHALNQLDSKYADLINFRLVGPLPPYSFATVVVESLDKEEVEAAKKLLKLDGELSKEKIKHAFNKLANQLHPDKGGDPLAFEFANKGYKLLRKYVEQGLIGVYLYQWEER